VRVETPAKDRLKPNIVQYRQRRYQVKLLEHETQLGTPQSSQD